jgi:toxin-antitoxin system PIN domain toxin
VIAVDTNILVYAHRRDAEFHEPAAEVLGKLANEGGAWAIPWPCIAEFYAVTTHARIYDPPSTLQQAVNQVDIWLEAPTVITVGETTVSWPALRNLLVVSKVLGSRIYDARIAALCLAHGVRELWTADRDYARFPALRTRNPLVAAS